MKKCEEASPSIILAGRALLVKMLITPEPRYAFGSNFEYFFIFIFLFIIFLFLICYLLFFVYLCSLTLSSYWYAKR